MRRAVQWQSHCHSYFAAMGVGARGGCPLPGEALKMEQLGYSVIQKQFYFNVDQFYFYSYNFINFSTSYVNV